MWYDDNGKPIKMPVKVARFIRAIQKVYTEYGLSIAHEDEHGAFIIETDSTINRNWLLCADFRSVQDIDKEENQIK